MTFDLPRPPRRRGWLVLLLLSLSTSTSIPACGPSSDQVPLHPTTGQVLLQGKPLAGVQVVFRPTKADQPGSSTASIGQTDAEGKFSMSTPAGEVGQLASGVPAGDYAVAIIAPTRSDAADFLNINKGGSRATPNPVKLKYSDVKTSGLKVTIKGGPNTLEPFALD